MLLRKFSDCFHALVKATYDYMLNLASRRNAMYFLFAVAFIESSFFPIPPDVMLIPMVLAAPAKAWRIAGIATAASVLGGAFGYAIGVFFFDLIARPILTFYGYMHQFDVFKDYYHEWGAWIVFGAGITPFPYKVITIASGVVHLDFAVFMLASVVARGMRFYLVAWLLKKYGEPMKDYIEKNLQDRFTPDDFDYAEVYDWKAFDYNTPEIGTLFLQIRDKLIAGETSRLYYESKVGELLSIVAGNFHKQRQEIASKHQSLSKQEKKALESVRLAIEQNILNPPELSQLCKIAAMGQTKLRESFKAMYGVPIGAYIRQAKMRYALLLMSKPNLTIGNIAEHLGYANASKFAATFRKVYGKSPEEYRNQKR